MLPTTSEKNGSKKVALITGITGQVSFLLTNRDIKKTRLTFLCLPFSTGDKKLIKSLILVLGWLIFGRVSSQKGLSSTWHHKTFLKFQHTPNRAPLSQSHVS